jgi:hypothetical protein
VPQKIVGRPGQVGDLGNELRLDPMQAGKNERRAEARFASRQDVEERRLQASGSSARGRVERRRSAIGGRFIKT